jgi:hypothetical protein
MNDKDILLQKIDKWHTLKKEILDIIGQMPRASDECKCKDAERVTIKIISEGTFDAIRHICTKCGGDIS